MIPSQLYPYRFLKLRQGGKKYAKHPAKGVLWSNPKHHHIFNSEDLQEHLAQGGNYGVLTGNGLLVVDTDSPEGEEIAKQLPETFTVKTAKGFHRYYQVDGSYKSSTGVKEGIDIRAEGGYVVAPNSIHDTGIKYEISNDMSIINISSDILYDVLCITITTTTTITNTTSNKNSHKNSEKNSENNILNKFLKGGIREYYFRTGISIVRIIDFENIREEKRYIKGKYINCFFVKGDLLKRPDGKDIIGTDFDIIFMPSAKSCFVSTFLDARNGLYLIQRVSERHYNFKIIEENDLESYLTMKDSDIINLVDEFESPNSAKSKDTSKRNKLLFQINTIREGVIPQDVNDEHLYTMGILMKREGFSDEDFIKVFQNYFGDRFDYKETITQLNYSKRCARIQ